MKKFGSVDLILSKDIEKGDMESLQTLFNSEQRYRRITLMADADEDAEVRVVLGGLGSADLKIGDDMEKGQEKTVMTLFWFAERAKPIEMKKKASAGSVVAVDMTLLP